MKKIVNGLFTELDGETFYKIENYDCMEDFFMTITSSSDIWNFCWSQGGITAGRVNSDFALFPYYTADKVSDAKMNTGHYAAIAIKTADGNCEIWEPFAPLLCNTALRFKQEEHITRNIYKNASGTKVWFEEVNTKLGLAFRYGWTSSAQFGLVRLAHIENLSDKPLQLSVLDGCRNIMPACTDANFQNNNSVLLDAYKKTDLDKSANIALFSLSSVVTDKAEPSEGLLANVSWFTTEEPVLLSPTAPQEFFEAQGDVSKLVPAEVIKGERPSCFVARSLTLVPKSSHCWEQVFDTSLSASRIAALKTVIADRSEARDKLIDDIEAGEKLMKQYLYETDGIQRTAEQMTSVHHQANVMFNIMRGGFFADNGKINAPDLLSFIKSRNAAKYEEAKQALGENADKNSLTKTFITEQFKATKDPQLIRLALEYMPIIFSRRHGDPSRPWNRFNIRLLDENKNWYIPEAHWIEAERSNRAFSDMCEFWRKKLNWGINAEKQRWYNRSEAAGILFEQYLFYCVKQDKPINNNVVTFPDGNRKPLNNAQVFDGWKESTKSEKRQLFLRAFAATIMDVVLIFREQAVFMDEEDNPQAVFDKWFAKRCQRESAFKRKSKPHPYMVFGTEPGRSKHYKLKCIGEDGGVPVYESLQTIQESNKRFNIGDYISSHSETLNAIVSIISIIGLIILFCSL